MYKKKKEPIPANTEHVKFKNVEKQSLQIKKEIYYCEPQPASMYEYNYVEYIENDEDTDNETSSVISSTSSVENFKENNSEEHNTNYSFICKLNQTQKKNTKVQQLTFEEYEEEV